MHTLRHITTALLSFARATRRAASLPKLFVASVLCGFSAVSPAAIFLAGPGAGCQFATIQAAIDAAGNLPGSDEVRIANTGVYSAQAITIGAQDLILTGAYANCTDTVPAGGSAIVSGQGGAAASVFSITGAGVRRFERLGIIRGDAPTTGRGGGIRFEGSGLLFLRGVSVVNNVAGGGGGIYFRGDGSPAELTLEQETYVQQNTATANDGFGGGIAVVNTARMVMLQNNTQISSNTATGVDSVGGGLAVFGTASADIGSPGAGINGAIYDNEAGSGGGIAVVNDGAGNPDGSPTRVRLFTTDANRPVRVNGNRAHRVGGAILVRPLNTQLNFFFADACIENGRLDNNIAQEGAAVYVDTNESLTQANLGGAFTFNAGCPSFPVSTSALGSIPCAASVVGCNQIAFNRARNIVNQLDTQGAVVLAQINSSVELNRVAFSDNISQHIIRSVEARGVSVNKCLIARNQTASHLIFADTDTDQLSVSNCTITGNTMMQGPATRIVQRNGGGTLRMKYNLLWQPGNFSLGYGGNVTSLNSDIEYNVTNAITSLPPSPWNQFQTLRFNDPARGDFRQRISSRGIDLFSPLANVGLDFDRRPYDQALSILGTSVQARDPGAFERQESDPWLINGDFNGDLNLWTGDNPGLTSYSALNAPGSSGGSLAFSRAPSAGATTPRFNAGVQCFNVPAPGRYQLTAQGRAPGNVFVTRNRPVIRWRLRSNSANCAQADPITLEGDLFLSNAVSFSAPLAPAEIIVTQALWSANATIEVRLDVEPALLDGAINAGFDRIEIAATDIDRMFANGFE